jgi:hypothetical protein
MPKPTQTADWANAASGGDVTPPSSGKINTGWVGNESPAHNFFNWWMNKADLWIDWLNAYESTAHTWTALQTFSSGVSVPQPAGNAPAYGSSWADGTGGITGLSGPLRQWRGVDGVYYVSGIAASGVTSSSSAGFTVGSFATHPTKQIWGSASNVTTGVIYSFVVNTDGSIVINNAGSLAIHASDYVAFSAFGLG